MSEKDIIENKDNSLDKAENKKMPSSVTEEKKIESKSDEVKSEDSDKESKDRTDKDVEVNKEIDVKKIEKGKTDDSLKNKPKKTLTSKDENFKKKSSPNSEKKQNSNENLSRRNEKDQNEFIEKLVSINRVAKVVKGGRRFSFAALVVVGDGNGMVGHGKGKAKEVPEAIKKATDEAKNTMIRVPLRQGRTLHHDIKGRFDSGNVFLRSAPSGTGVIAGGPMRAVFEALGIQDIVAKSIGSSNPHNMVRATFEALKVVSSPKIIASRRGLKVNDITKRRKNTSSIENAKA
jgi:small subunit ribosomal protein S5